jgi:hypothetical protein
VRGSACCFAISLNQNAIPPPRVSAQRTRGTRCIALHACDLLSLGRRVAEYHPDFSGFGHAHGAPAAQRLLLKHDQPEQALRVGWKSVH